VGGGKKRVDGVITNINTLAKLNLLKRSVTRKDVKSGGVEVRAVRKTKLSQFGALLHKASKSGSKELVAVLQVKLLESACEAEEHAEAMCGDLCALERSEFLQFLALTGHVAQFHI